MDCLPSSPESAFGRGVAAAELLSSAVRFGDMAIAAPAGSDDRAYAEEREAAALEAACAAEEAILLTLPTNPYDQAAVAVAGFAVMTRLVAHDTFDRDKTAAGQAAAVRRAFAALALATCPDALGHLCDKETLAQMAGLTGGRPQNGEVGPLLITSQAAE